MFDAHDDETGWLSSTACSITRPTASYASSCAGVYAPPPGSTDDGGGLGSAPQVQLPQRGEVEMALGGLGAPLPPAEGDAWSCELDCELGGRGGVVAQAALAIEWLPAVGLEDMRSDIS